jgi:hypothetical protein
MFNTIPIESIISKVNKINKNKYSGKNFEVYML